MKFISLFLTGLLFSMSAPALPSHLDDIRKVGVLHAATEGAFPPFNFFKGKDLVGFEVDLTNEIGKRMGLKVDWRTYSFDSLLIGLEEHRYDVVAASHAITPERAKAVDFANPHYCTGGVLLTKAGGPLSTRELASKVVAVGVGTSYAQYLSAQKGVTVRTYPKDLDAIQALIAGNVDAMMTDKFSILDLKKQGKLPGLKYSGIVEYEKVAIAVPKNEPQLLAALNAGLQKTLDDGTYAKLSNKYFGEDIRCK